AGVGALLLGAAAGPALLVGGFLGAVCGMTGGLFGCIIGNGRAEDALDRDLDNGLLIRRFQDEVLAPSASLSGPGAKPAFTAAAERPSAGNDNPAPRIATPKTPAAGL